MNLSAFFKSGTLAILLTFLCLLSKAQTSQIRENAPRVFIDCEECDMEHMRTEINFVNFVTEMRECDIHIIIVTQTTGSGGNFYTLYFIGQKEYYGKKDTLDFNSSPDDTYSIRRQKLVNFIKLGLIDFVKTSPLAEHIRVSFSPPVIETPAIRDKWKHWVFRIRGDGVAVGQDSYRNYHLSSSISADKVTKDFKTGFTASFGYSELDYRPDYNYLSKHTSFDFLNTTVFSINNHWSWGFRARTFRSTFSNTSNMTSLTPAIEYNILPYDQATTRQVRIGYSVGPQNWNYIDTTFLYNVLEDFLWQHSLDIASEFVQKWGRIRFSAIYSNYLHDFTLGNLRMVGSISLRIIKGLELNLYGSYSIINDQHFIAKKGATIEDVLLRRRQLPSSYSFRASFGISYTFGSIYSNVVNPRFGY